MGIETQTARFLLGLRQRGVSFSRCATLGRQHYFLSRNETANLLRSFGIDPASQPELMSDAPEQFSEPFWKFLGAQDLVTIDASDFEGATRVHDMNKPVPEELKESFDAVCDIGTLEHVFNFPNAIANCMSMVKVGGHFVAQTPANNFFGHGFYQFSPELFYRVLSPQNGFQMERVVALEVGPRRRWFEVSDPDAIKARVPLINSFPVLLLLSARKTASVPLLVQAPQQSDYAVQWSSASSDGSKATSTGGNPSKGRFASALSQRAPALVRFFEAFTFTSLNRGLSFRNPRAFKRVRDKR